MTDWKLTTALAALLLLPGCRDTAAPPAKDGAATPENGAAAPAIPPELATPRIADIRASFDTWDNVQKFVAAYAAARKVVVIDVWSLHCPPCLREFPGIVKLAGTHRANVACISFNLDYDGDKDDPSKPDNRAEIKKFLKDQKAEFQHVISTEPSEDFLNRIKLGGPPAVFVYDKSGKLAKRFDNSDSKQPEFTYEKDVIPLVEKLLAEK